MPSPGIVCHRAPWQTSTSRSGTTFRGPQPARLRTLSAATSRTVCCQRNSTFGLYQARARGLSVLTDHDIFADGDATPLHLGRAVLLSSPPSIGAHQYVLAPKIARPLSGRRTTRVRDRVRDVRIDLGAGCNAGCRINTTFDPSAPHQQRQFGVAAHCHVLEAVTAAGDLGAHNGVFGIARITQNDFAVRACTRSDANHRAPHSRQHSPPHEGSVRRLSRRRHSRRNSSRRSFRNWTLPSLPPSLLPNRTRRSRANRLQSWCRCRSWTSQAGPRR